MMDYKTRSLEIEQVGKATTKLKQRQTMESGIRVGELSTQIVHMRGTVERRQNSPMVRFIEVGIIQPR